MDFQNDHTDIYEVLMRILADLPHFPKTETIYIPGRNHNVLHTRQPRFYRHDTRRIFLLFI